MLGLTHRETPKKVVLIFVITLSIFVAGYLIIQNKPSSIDRFSHSASVAVILIASVSLVIIFHFRYFYLQFNDKKSEQKISFKWFLSAILLLPLLFLISWLFVSLSSENFQLTLASNGSGELIKLLILIFAMNLILGGSMGEEFGWRGYLLPILLRHYNPAAASLILGLIWIVWHLPVDITNQVAAAPFVIIFRIFWTFPLTIIFTWFYLKTNGSVLVALFLHTSVNILPDLGFSNYESALFLMTLFIIIVSGIIVARPEMRMMIHFNDRGTGGK